MKGGVTMFQLLWFWVKVEDAWFRFLWWVYSILMKPISAPKWWQKLKRDFSESNISDRNLLIGLVVSAVVLVAVVLTFFATLFRFTIFSSAVWKWSWSFAASLTILVALYLICDRWTKRREQREQSYAMKHTESTESSWIMNTRILRK